MTEPKFTPGPWYQGGGDYRHDVFDRKASRNPDGIREGETPNLIITVTSENVDADVKLIAAAPRLYKALESFVIAMRAGVTHEEIMANIEAADREARLALADARGGMMGDKFKALRESDDPLEFCSNKNPRCPHCGSDFDIEEGEAWELYSDDGGMGHEVECQDCNLTFTVTTHTTYLFSTDEQDDDEDEDEKAKAREER